MKQKLKITGILTFFAFLLFSTGAFANKTSVKVVAPEKAKVGTEITIKIEVSHMGNSRGHHTDWVSLKINGKEVKKWEYTKDILPENSTFTLEYKIKTDKNLEIIAQGHCNRHGSKGEDKVTVIVE
jgi:desulfoferrodoxin (superoxide reductase-like protein)